MFIDCLLVGNYLIEGDCITSAGRGRGEEFRRMDIVQLIDYFHKIDESRITKLKIIVRKLGTVRGGQGKRKIGRPQEIAMYFAINHLENHLTSEFNQINFEPKNQSQIQFNMPMSENVPLQNQT